MKGCPEFGCLRLSNLEDAKEICVQDKTCNGVVSCPYSECHIFEIRRGPILTTNHWPNLKENVFQLTRLPCKGKNVYLSNLSFPKTKLMNISIGRLLNSKLDLYRYSYIVPKSRC